MNIYNNLVKKFIKNKYKQSTVFSKYFLDKYKVHRNILLGDLKKLEIKPKQFNTINDQTYENLKNIYFNNLFIRKLKYILIYHKKFESNVSLKKNYNRNFKKKTNIETNYNSYIFLGLIIAKTDRLNLHQKINCILKIIDKLSVNIHFLERNNLYLFKKLLFIEKKFINQVF